jgi:hypothetical protein
MNRQAVRVLCAVALGGLVLAAAGCGGGKSSTPTTATSETTTEAASMTTETTATTSTDTAGTVGALLSSKNCAQLVNASTSFSQAFTGAVSDSDLQKAEGLLKEFADKTPDEIRPDFEELASVYAKYAEALKGADLSSGKTPSPEVIARLQKLSTEIDQTKLAEASQHISAWIQKNCSGG